MSNKAKVSSKQTHFNLQGHPLRRDVIVTLDVEKVNDSGIILSANHVKNTSEQGQLLDDQRVVAVGTYCDQVMVGDKVKIDFDKYKKEIKEDRFSGKHSKTYEWQIPIIEFNGVKYGRIQEHDIIWIFDDKEA